MMSLKFELLSKSNFDEALAIQRLCFPDEDENAEIDFKAVLDPQIRSEWKGELVDWVIFNDTKPVGIVGLYSYPEYKEDAWIDWFAILPEFRGKGYARITMDFIEAEAKRRNFKNLRSYTGEHANKEACHFFQGLGWKSEPYLGEDRREETLIFSKSLQGGEAPAWDNRYLHFDMREIRRSEGRNTWAP